jgi:hypothetical protein
MRKPRDIDAELKALQDKQHSLKLKRITQFGELVTATSSGALDLKSSPVCSSMPSNAKADPSVEAWQQRNQSFFRRDRRAKANGTGPAASRAPSNHGDAAPNHSSAQPS